MGARVASTPLHSSHSVIPKPPSAFRTPPSAVLASSASLNRRNFPRTASSTQLLQPRSRDFLNHRPRLAQQVCSGSFDSFSEEASPNQDEELTSRLGHDFASISGDDFFLNGVEAITSEWENGANFPASIELKASCKDLPLSVRMLKRKLQWQEGFREAGELAHCSIKNAFSSMVFIVREMQSYTLQMRGIPLYEDLQGLLVRVQEDTHASFVWLFQKVFSQTPSLMVYLMILLANYSAHSMGCAAATVSPWPPLESVSMVEIREIEHKTFSIPSPASTGKSTSMGGRDGGGGGNILPGVSGTGEEGDFGRSGYEEAMFPNGSSLSSSLGSTREEEDLWKSIVEEALEMQAAIRDESLNHETMENMVAPVIAKAEVDDDYSEYMRTEVLYEIELSQDPNNQLLLANYAQFLYLVAHDYDRAEEYFKKAVAVEPRDAEALNKYATFLWRVRNDLWAAEETFLEAIDVDPTNSFYAANYAHFLWNTGGEDTCFPLASLDQDSSSHSQEA